MRNPTHVNSCSSVRQIAIVSMASPGEEIPASADGVTSSWLSSVLGCPVVVESCSRATDAWHMGQAVRVAITPSDTRSPAAGLPLAGVASLVVKLAPDDASTCTDAARKKLLCDIIAREAAFFSSVGPALSTVAPPVKACLPQLYVPPLLSDDGLRTALVMQDLSHTRKLSVTDAVTGFTAEGAEAAVRALGVFHAASALVGPASIGSYSPGEWNDAEDRLVFASPDTETFVAGFKALPGVTPDFVAAMRASCEHAAWFREKCSPGGVPIMTHGDYKADNVFVGPCAKAEAGAGAGSAVIIDWQMYRWGSPLAAAADLTQVLTVSMDTELRRQHEKKLVAAYCEAFSATVRDHGTHGGDSSSDAACVAGNAAETVGSGAGGAGAGTHGVEGDVEDGGTHALLRSAADPDVVWNNVRLSLVWKFIQMACMTGSLDAIPDNYARLARAVVDRCGAAAADWDLVGVLNATVPAPES